jgi:hypothetical protein
MFKRLLLCLFLMTAAFRAGAVDYTDIYYIPAESGWGVNVVQSGTDFNFMFVTFFIYGPDNKPTWYTAQLTRDASGNFNGSLYATTGTFYTMPWKTSDLTAPVVGTASFQPTSAYTAKLIYTVTTPAALAGTVTKLIQRQSLTSIAIGGTYVGGQSGAYSGCNSSSNNGGYTDFFNLQVNQSTNGSVTFTFTYSGSLTCTMSGTLTQFGQLYTMPTTAYTCSDGLNTNASMTEIKATGLGLEGRLAAPAVGGGCREDATFSGVLH